MPSLKIVINSIEDAKAGKPIVEEINKDLSNLTEVESEKMTIGILEKGTQAGQTSLMVIMKTPDGKFVMSQITGNMFEALISAYRGANERFANGGK